VFESSAPSPEGLSPLPRRNCQLRRRIRAHQMDFRRQHLRLHESTLVAVKNRSRASRR